MNEKKTRPVYSAIDTRVQTEFVSHMLTNGINTPSLIRSAFKKEHGKWLSFKRISVLVARVRAKWSTEDDFALTQKRSEALRRHYAHLRRAMAAQEHTVVVQLEKAISELEGTKMPMKVEVHVDVAQALMATIGTMDAIEMNTMLSEWQQTVELAEERKKLVLVGSQQTEVWDEVGT